MSQQTGENLKTDAILPPPVPLYGTATTNFGVPQQGTYQQVVYPVAPNPDQIQGPIPTQPQAGISTIQVQPVMHIPTQMKTPLLSDQSTMETEFASDIKEPVSVKCKNGNCFARCCKCCCCGFCVTMLICCVCFCCVTVFGGVISGIVTGAMYGACVNNQINSEKYFSLNSSITDLSFDHFGKFKVLETESEYGVQLNLFVKEGSDLKVNIDELTHSASFELYGWTVFGNICEGMDITLSIPKDFASSVSITLKNHYDDVDITLISNLRKLSVEKHYGLFGLKNLIVAEDATLSLHYTDLSSDALTVTNDLNMEADYGKSTFNNFKIENGNFGLVARYSDTAFNTVDVHGNITLDNHYNNVIFNCKNEGNFQGLDIHTHYGDVVVKNCGVFGENSAEWKLDAKYSNIHYKDITRLGQWIKLKAGKIDYSDITFERVDQVDADFGDELVRYSTIFFRMDPQSFGLFEMDFDITGGYSDFSASDSTGHDYITKDIDTSSHLSGKINKGGVVDAHGLAAKNIKYSDFNIRINNPL